VRGLLAELLTRLNLSPLLPFGVNLSKPNGNNASTSSYQWYLKAWLIISLQVLSACQSPVAKLQTQAEQLQLKRLEWPANSYVISLFYQPGNTSKPLHVYLEGDGQPWLKGLSPAIDPTTRDSLMLPLLALDQSPALYLGRPCYNGHAQDVGCDHRIWTSARYSREVVDALASALESFCKTYGYQHIVLMGHSGGGTLALLLAQRLPQTQLVITLAGNYDIDAWADYHHYLRLTESLNPAQQHPTGIPEWHFLGELDTVIPPQLIVSALKQRANSQVEVLPNINHQEGWQTIWPQILKRFALQ
jgi:hypothetical protein